MSQRVTAYHTCSIPSRTIGWGEGSRNVQSEIHTWSLSRKETKQTTSSEAETYAWGCEVACFLPEALA